MFTRCTHCDALLRITANQLSMARGAVRCGKCSNVFNALTNLSEHMPEGAAPASEAGVEASAREPTWSLADEIYKRERSTRGQPQETVQGAGPETAEPLLSQSDADMLEGSLQSLEKQALDDTRLPDKMAGVSVSTSGEEDEQATKNEVDDALRRILPLLHDQDAGESTDAAALLSEPGAGPGPVARESARDRGSVQKPGALDTHADDATAVRMDSDELPQVLEEHVAFEKKGRRSLSPWIYGVLTISLLVLLAVQYAWFMPDDVVNRYPPARSLVAALCEKTGCELGRSADAERMQIASRDVRIHPKYEGALLVTAALVNAAYDVQPYPRIQFILYNASGAPIATRVFEPDEYLSPDVAHELGMVPRQPVQIALDLLAPEEAAVSFEFKFLP